MPVDVFLFSVRSFFFFFFAFIANERISGKRRVCANTTRSQTAHNVITSARGIKHDVIYLLPVLSLVMRNRPFFSLTGYGHTAAAAAVVTRVWHYDCEMVGRRSFCQCSSRHKPAVGHSVYSREQERGAILYYYFFVTFSQRLCIGRSVTISFFFLLSFEWKKNRSLFCPTLLSLARTFADYFYSHSQLKNLSFRFFVVVVVVFGSAELHRAMLLNIHPPKVVCIRLLPLAFENNEKTLLFMHQCALPKILLFLLMKM